MSVQFFLKGILLLLFYHLNTTIVSVQSTVSAVTVAALQNLNTTIVSVQLLRHLHRFRKYHHLNTTIVSVQSFREYPNAALCTSFKYNHCVSSIKPFTFSATTTFGI